MPTIILRNPIRDRMENAYKNVFKKYGFKYNKDICMITKNFKNGYIRVSFDYDAGVLIGWTLSVIDSNYKVIFEKVFSKSESFDIDSFEDCYLEAKAALKGI